MAVLPALVDCLVSIVLTDPFLTPSKDKEAQRTVAEEQTAPVIYQDTQGYYRKVYAPNISIAPIAYKERIANDDPIIQKAIVKTEGEEVQKVFGKQPGSAIK